MATTVRASGVSVSVSGPIALESTAPLKRSTRPAAAKRGIGAGTADPVLLQALQRQDFELVETVPLKFAAAARPKKRGGAAPPAAVTLDVPLGADEQAVVLLDDEGEFRWVVDGMKLPSAAPKRGRAAGARKQVRFSIRLEAAPPAPAPAKRGGRKRNWLTDKLAGKVVAYVFRFAMKVAGKQVIAYLERNIERGLVSIAAPEPQHWTRLADDAPLPTGLPADRPARVLLFVHGTFSSTAGSFGALGIVPKGRDFLARAFQHYDVVLGFDHPTLSIDPLRNASDMLARLRAIEWPHPPQIEIVAFSRGGLVARSLIEHLLPGAGWGATLGRVVFVGCTNGGTQLAEPANWHRFADHYTNLALGATRLLSLIPGAQGWTTIADQVIGGVGALVKALASGAITDKVVPGLAAMEPDGDFVKKINSSQAGQPAAADAQYYAVCSDFEPGKALADGGTPELPPKLLIRIADWGADELYGEANDLVVHVRSMTEIDPALGRFVKDKLDYGTNGIVYHTNYFTRDTTAAKLSEWFALPQLAAASPKRSLKRKPGGAMKKAAPKRSTPKRSAPKPSVKAAATQAAERMASKKGKATVDAAIKAARKTLNQGAKKKPAPKKAAPKKAARNSSVPTKAVPKRGLPKAKRAAPRPKPSVKRPTKRGQVKKSRNASFMKPLSPAAARALGAGGPRPTRSFPFPTGSMPDAAAAATPPSAGEPASAGTPAAAARPPKRSAKRPSAKTAARPPMKNGGGSAALESAGAEPTDNADETNVQCHFRAEMDSEVVIDETVSVDVTIARQELEVTPGRAGESAGAAIDTKRKLIVQIAERRNFRVTGERRIEIDVPATGDETNLSFDVKGVQAGDGELWVSVRQGPVPLVTLKLKPRIVATAGAGTPVRLPVEASIEGLPVAEEPLDQLLIEESFIGDDVVYRYYFDMPTLRQRKRFESKVITGRDTYISKKMNRIGEAWAGSGKGQLEAFETDLKAIGAEMFTELMPREMQDFLWDNRERIKSVQVFSMEPFVPWELVYLKKPTDAVISDDSQFLGELGVTRWLYDSYPPSRLKLETGRVRYIVPTYTGENQLPDAAGEVKMMKDLFKAFKPAPVTALAADVQKLLRAVNGFDLLHYAGHAEAAGGDNADARLLLDELDDDSTENALLATTVAQTARLAGEGRQPIVVLNGCESGRAHRGFGRMGGFATAFVSRGAGVFVGTHWSVGDAPARTFIQTFYETFAVRKPGAKPVELREAVQKARKAARDGGDATWIAYVVYGHPRAVVT